MKLASTDRVAGSVEDFDADWAEALRSGGRRWLIFPDWAAMTQVALAEWVKAQQIDATLHSHDRLTGRVLEYGCGAAGMSIYLSHRGYTCITLDRSWAALEVAALNECAHSPTGRPIIRVVGDVRAMPFAEDAFDVVMSYGLLEHFAGRHLSDVLHESVRALSHGGTWIADIVPSRPNARAVGTLLSFAGSALHHILRGRARDLSRLRRAYFDHYFESSLGPEAWGRLLHDAGLERVLVRVCRPFPPLALSGWAERLYVSLMRWSLPAWRRFDESGSPLARAWGWMYLCTGRKPGPEPRTA